ncbi:MAG: hypothetical protein AB7G21_10320 [Dehalococcoidia bacterium]
MDDAVMLPGNMTEAEFLHAYATSALRKPQVVADNVLTGIFLTDVAYRGALTALLVQESVEAARRLAAVWLALTDRTRSVARTLAGPLPGAEAWLRFASAVEDAARAEQPAALLRAMAIDDSALQSAQELCAFEGLARFDVPMRVYEAGPPVVSVQGGGAAATLLLSNLAPNGERVATRMTLADEQIIALGDATGDFTTWAGDFLGAYVEGRGGR